MRCLTLAVFLICIALTVEAADANGRYWSQGGATCGEFIDGLSDWRESAYFAYVAGYVTAYNRERPDTFNILESTDIKGTILWIKNYCDANPLKTMGDAMAELTVELYPTRRRSGGRTDRYESPKKGMPQGSLLSLEAGLNEGIA